MWKIARTTLSQCSELFNDVILNGCKYVGLDVGIRQMSNNLITRTRRIFLSLIAVDNRLLIALTHIENEISRIVVFFASVSDGVEIRQHLADRPVIDAMSSSKQKDSVEQFENRILWLMDG